MNQPFATGFSLETQPSARGYKLYTLEVMRAVYCRSMSAKGGLMTDRTDSTSPQTYARIAGWLYLFIIVAAMFAEIFVRGKLIDYADATATAHNILINESLFRLAGAVDLLVFICDLALALIFYVLLRPVNKNLALLAAFFRLVYAAIVGVNTVYHFAALLLLGGAPYLTVFKVDQLHALALLSLKTHALGYNVALVFFGFHCLVLGYLIFKSEYLPKILGILLVIAGPCYIVNSFAHFVAPVSNLYPAILVPCFIAELSLTVWLIVKGVNLPKWESAQFE